jgi:hypothetical protein
MANALQVHVTVLTVHAQQVRHGFASALAVGAEGFFLSRAWIASEVSDLPTQAAGDIGYGPEGDAYPDRRGEQPCPDRHVETGGLE